MQFAGEQTLEFGEFGADDVSFRFVAFMLVSDLLAILQGAKVSAVTPAAEKKKQKNKKRERLRYL